ncbi:MAG: hypothetical protein F6K56_33645, partial [Moorea sp. SIO3G5]|nr:hypothetical protein [Moorena sp. SIO3G5]
SKPSTVKTFNRQNLQPSTLNLQPSTVKTFNLQQFSLQTKTYETSAISSRISRYRH